jgi:hypothetical protein
MGGGAGGAGGARALYPPLISDYNATVTDPVAQKSCNLWRRFFCALWGYISPLSNIVQANILLYLNLGI